MFHQFFWRGQFPFAESFGETFAYSVIIDWPDIRPPKIKEKQHLDRPATDAAHLRETGDNLVVTQSEESASRWHCAVDRLCSEIL